MENRITFNELVNATTDKYKVKFLQAHGFFSSEMDGLYDRDWITVYEESRSYMHAGFDEMEAYAEACHDVFGYYPECWN